MKKKYNLNDLPSIAKDIIENVSNKVLLFYGDMGVGKTTLIKELVRQLNVDDIVSSPTFSLVNEYRSQDGNTIYHFDFYRIEEETEALDMGIEDYFDDDAWCFVEWPNKVKNLVPLNAVAIHLTLNEDQSRTISIK